MSEQQQKFTALGKLMSIVLVAGLIALGCGGGRENPRPNFVVKQIDHLPESADRWQISFRGGAIRGHGDGA